MQWLLIFHRFNQPGAAPEDPPDQQCGPPALTTTELYEALLALIVPWGLHHPKLHVMATD